MMALILAEVPDLISGNTARRRFAALAEDRETIAVAAGQAGDAYAEREHELSHGDAQKLAEAVLSGDRRAVTTPGLARKLSAFALVLFRVCRAANALQHIEGFDDGFGGHPDDREAATGDEGAEA